MSANENPMRTDYDDEKKGKSGFGVFILILIVVAIVIGKFIM